MTSFTAYFFMRAGEFFLFFAMDVLDRWMCVYVLFLVSHFFLIVYDYKCITFLGKNYLFVNTSIIKMMKSIKCQRRLKSLIILAFGNKSCPKSLVSSLPVPFLCLVLSSFIVLNRCGILVNTVWFCLLSLSL